MAVNIYYFQFVPESKEKRAVILKKIRPGKGKVICILDLTESTANPSYYEFKINEGFDLRNNDRVEILGDEHTISIDEDNNDKNTVNKRVIIPFRYFCVERKGQNIFDIRKYYGPDAINQVVTTITPSGSSWAITNGYIIMSGEPSQGVVDIDENLSSISFPHMRGGRKSRRSTRRKRRRTRRRKRSK
jgi:hypothetical protein